MSYFFIANATKTARGMARSNISLVDVCFGVFVVLCLFGAVYAVIGFDRLFICRSRAVVQETAKAILAFEDEVMCQKLGMNNPQWRSNKYGSRFYCQKDGELVEVERKR